MTLPDEYAADRSSPESPLGTPPERKHRLRLLVEVGEMYCDDLHESARIMTEPDEPTEDDYLFLVTEEWMREEVTLTIVTYPGEKCMNHEFDVVPFRGRIVGVSMEPPHTIAAAGASDVPTEREAGPNP